MSQAKKHRRAASITVDQDARELVVGWKDGSVSRYALEELRRTCPCANCKEARQKAASHSINLLQGEAPTATAEVRSVERVGRYGLRITWADGHDYGIYTFESLRDRETRSASGS